jgi:hypothetical protein
MHHHMPGMTPSAQEGDTSKSQKPAPHEVPDGWEMNQNFNDIEGNDSSANETLESVSQIDNNNSDMETPTIVAEPDAPPNPMKDYQIKMAFP